MKPLPSRITLGGELTVSRLGYGTIHLTEQRGFGVAREKRGSIAGNAQLNLVWTLSTRPPDGAVDSTGVMRGQRLKEIVLGRAVKPLDHDGEAGAHPPKECS